MIPFEDRFAVDRPNAIIHKPYVEHAAGLPRTSRRGVMATVSDPQPCTECWPPIETESYYCEQCERQHNEGSAIYDRHKVLAPHDAQPVAEPLVPSAVNEAVPEPYFPPYQED